MPDNRDLPERSKREDDVPFQLPSEDDSSESGDIVPLRTDPNVITGNFEYVDQPALNAGEDDDVPFKLPKAEDFIDPEALTENTTTTIPKILYRSTKARSAPRMSLPVISRRMTRKRMCRLSCRRAMTHPRVTRKSGSSISL